MKSIRAVAKIDELSVADVPSPKRAKLPVKGKSKKIVITKAATKMVVSGHPDMSHELPPRIRIILDPKNYALLPAPHLADMVCVAIVPEFNSTLAMFQSYIWGDSDGHDSSYQVIRDVEELKSIFIEALGREVRWSQAAIKDTQLENYRLREACDSGHATIRSLEKYIGHAFVHSAFVFLELPPVAPAPAGAAFPLVQDLPRLPIGTRALQFFVAAKGVSGSKIECRIEDRVHGRVLANVKLKTDSIGWVEVPFSSPTNTPNNALRVTFSTKPGPGQKSVPTVQFAFSSPLHDDLGARSGSQRLASPLAMRVLVGPPVAPAPRLKELLDDKAGQKFVLTNDIVRNLIVLRDGKAQVAATKPAQTSLTVAIGEFNRVAHILLREDIAKALSASEGDLRIFIADVCIEVRGVPKEHPLMCRLLARRASTGEIIRTAPIGYEFRNGWRLSMASEVQSTSKLELLLEIQSAMPIEHASVTIHGLRCLEF